MSLTIERKVRIMNSKILLAAFAVAAAATGVARADEADGSQNVIQFHGTRTRAEVAAEAVQAVAHYNPEPAGSRVLAMQPSSVSRQAVIAQAAQAMRLGQIPSGEKSL